MANYLQHLNPTQKRNMAAIITEMKRVGITNPYTQVAILSIISKESEFIWTAEKSYAHTSNAQIRKVFSKLAALSDKQLDALKANEEMFFNTVYGGQYGNAPTEGYKYRGRGPNQLTFKDNYASIGKRIGADLVKNPDLLVTDSNVAARAVIDFFVREFNTGAKKGYLSQFNTKDINGFTNLNDSLNAVFQANRGWKKKGPDTTGGYDKAKSRITDFQTVVNVVSENKAATGSGIFFLILGIVAISKRKKISEAFKNIKKKRS